MTRRPDRGEAAEHYFIYINQVADGDIRHLLHEQLSQTLALLEPIDEEQSRHRYAAGKWSMREVLSHVNDTERVFVFRAFWFARGIAGPLASFDQEVAAAHASGDARPWNSHVEEFRAVRAATLAFFDSLPDQAWARGGIASDNPVTVRALAYITAGHVAHHMAILRSRYARV
jgi:uncharacterized damage-inducible protein DinB